MKRNYRTSSQTRANGRRKRVSANRTTWPAVPADPTSARLLGEPTIATLKSRAKREQEFIASRVNALQLSRTLAAAKDQARAQHHANKPKPKAVKIRNCREGLFVEGRKVV